MATATAEPFDVWPSRRIVELHRRSTEPRLLCVHEGGELALHHWEPHFRDCSWASRAGELGYCTFPRTWFSERRVITHDTWELWSWSSEGRLLARQRTDHHIGAVEVLHDGSIVVAQADGVTTLHDEHLAEIARHVGPPEHAHSIAARPEVIAVGRTDHVALLAPGTLEEVACLPLAGVAGVCAFQSRIVVDRAGPELFVVEGARLRRWRAGGWTGVADEHDWIVDPHRGLLAFTAAEEEAPAGCVSDITGADRPHAVLGTGGMATIVVGLNRAWTVDRSSWTARVVWESDRDILAEVVIDDSLLIAVDGDVVRVRLNASVAGEAQENGTRAAPSPA